jgi:hypothetical protein
MGAAMDFPIKVFIPSWIIFQVCLMATLSRIFTSQSGTIDKIRGVTLIVLLGIGSIGAINDIVVALNSGLFNSHVHRNGILPINAYKDTGSLQLFSDGQTFFWKYLAKKIVYDKTTSRETLIDKFGNRFRLELIRCNEKQGFYVSVNGTQQGCCVKLTKNKDGFIEALDGFGDKWIYRQDKWIMDTEILVDKIGNTFRMDIYNRCNEAQGFYILVNGEHQGCCIKLEINKDGFAKALDGLGDTWTYKDRSWIKD